jgi:hypothetical protein
MSTDALFSAAVAKDVFSEAPAAARPAAHLCCRFCGSDRPGTRECCVRIAEQAVHGSVATRDGTNFSVVCCRRCYRRGVALGLARVAGVAWLVAAAVAGPVALVALAAAGVPTPQVLAAAAAVVAAVALPVLLYPAFARRRLAALLGPDREERLRHRVGVTTWGLWTAVGFRPKVPPGEVCASLDGV